jgi:FdhD protein
MTSSCGVCGKSSIEAIHVACTVLNDALTVTKEVLFSLPEALAQKQLIFGVTGGLHATGLIDSTGEMTLLREDIGRHNALDKIIGANVLKKNLPLHNSIALLSGRAGFELVQKAIRAQIPIVASVGAPSSLAVKLAKEFNLTLIGFLKEMKFNVYAGEQRVI